MYVVIKIANPLLVRLFPVFCDQAASNPLPLKENIKRGVGEFEKAAKKNDAEKAQAADNSICLAEARSFAALFSLFCFSYCKYALQLHSYAKYKSVHPFAYCALAGTFGAQNILFGKMVAVLMGISFSGDK